MNAKSVVGGPRGYTLLELLITLAVLALVTVIAMPGFQDSISRNARDSAVLELMSALALARSAAVESSFPAILCRSSNQQSCNGAAGDWQTGWLVYQDLDGDGLADANELLQAQGALDIDLDISLFDGDNDPLTGDLLRFDREGFLANSSNRAWFRVCPPDDQAADARGVLILNTGRASQSRDDADGVHNDLEGDDISC